MTFRDLCTAATPPFRAVLFDIDGTVSAGRRAMPGVAELLEYLRTRGIPFLFLTNDGNHSPEEKNFFLSRAGIHAAPEEIVSCGHALPELAAQRRLTGRRAFIMGELGNPCFAEAAGLIPCRDLNRIDACALVIAGEGDFDWRKVFTGVINFFRRHPDRPLVVPNPDTYWPNVHDGEYGIGAGGQARFLCSVLREMGVAVEPVYLGKPYPPIYRHALHTLEIRFGLTELKPEEVAAVGDSLTSDIAGARRAGMRSVLVLTGITTPEILSRAAPELRPDHVCEAIG